MRRLCETKLSWICKTINNLNRLNSTGLQVKIKQLLNFDKRLGNFPEAEGGYSSAGIEEFPPAPSSVLLGSRKTMRNKEYVKTIASLDLYLLRFALRKCLTIGFKMRFGIQRTREYFLSKEL